jgi:prevent-host-death family protein
MNPYQTRSIKETREQLSQLVEEVAIAKKRYLITKFGKPKAMIVPLSTSQGKKAMLKGIEASFGAWKDRKDIQDSAKWVAKLRHRISSRHGNIFS